MSTFNYLYKKRIHTTIVTVAAMAGITFTAMPFSFAEAANNESPVKDIVTSFLESRQNNSSSSVWDLLPPGIAKKIFGDMDMPGVGNDHTNPTISGINTDFNNDQVTISWMTNERTRGTVFVSEEPNVDMDDEDTLEFSSWKLSSNHSITTDDLDPDTTYYAVIKATDQAGNETLSNEFHFTTQEEDNTDEDAPMISNLDTEVNDNSVTVTWETNEEANSKLYLSKTTPVNPHAAGTIKVTDATFDENHELTANNLEMGTTYYGIVTSTDHDGNTSSSTQFTVTTDEADEDAPMISNLDTEVNDNSVMVTWRTDEDANSKLYLSKTTPVNPHAAGTIKVTDATFDTDHELTAHNLEMDTTYHGIVTSTDKDGNTATSSHFTVTTSEDDNDDDTNPVITNIDWDANSSSVTFTWDTDEPATSAVYTSTTSGFALDDDDVEVEESSTLKTSHSITVTGLDSNTTYYHRIVSADENGNETMSTQRTTHTD